ncbi:MAG: tyrosine-protein phosphatase [Pseudomonadota bacterium]
MQDRIKPFETIRNFRDFGAYPGAGGRVVIRDTLFRSAQFGAASPEDLEALSAFNITVQADLRRPDERERHGHRWPGPDVAVLKSDKGRAKDAPHVRFLTEVAVDAAKARDWMIDYYRDAPFKAQHVDTFRAWFEALADLPEGESAVVNCAAGKDRTGILCALTHHALGVPREAIFEDYILTNRAARVDERLPEMARLFNQHINKAYDDAVYQPFVGVDTVFLSAAIETIEAREGSLDEYLSNVLGLDAKARDRLRGRYLI